MLDILIMYPALFACVVGIISLIVGSFLNVVIHRLPRMLEIGWRQEATQYLGLSEKASTETYNLILPRSQCPHCQHLIRFYDNIPVMSYLILSGRCRDCRMPISARYPLIELLTMCLSMWVALHFGVTWESLWALGFTWCLIALFFIDAHTQLLPDSLTLPLLWSGLLLSVGAPEFFVRPSEAILGAVAGYLSLWSVYVLFKALTGKEGMGYGDFKLLAAMGAWLGAGMLPFILLLSASLGTLVGVSMILLGKHTRTAPMAFGPYLAFAGVCACLYGHTFNHWYLHTLW